MQYGVSTSYVFQMLVSAIKAVLQASELVLSLCYQLLDCVLNLTNFFIGQQILFNFFITIIYSEIHKY